MKDEIKEILAYFEEYVKTTDMHYSEPMLNWKDLKIVLDYITNLQEIIEKAIEYIHNHQLVFELSSKKQIQYWFDMFYKDLINILSGVDKDEN